MLFAEMTDEQADIFWFIEIEETQEAEGEVLFER